MRSNSSSMGFHVLGSRGDHDDSENTRQAPGGSGEPQQRSPRFAQGSPACSNSAMLARSSSVICRTRPRRSGATKAARPSASDNGSSANRIGPMFPVVSARSRDHGDVAAPVIRLESNRKAAIPRGSGGDGYRSSSTPWMRSRSSGSALASHGPRRRRRARDRPLGAGRAGVGGSRAGGRRPPT